MATVPVYLFTGFLEGGKTHIIQESMEDKKFNSGEKTLLLVCEEGVDEYDLDRFWGKNVYLETLESEEELQKEHLTALAKKHRIDRVIIEYNGMWPMQKLYDSLPEGWAIYQEMMFADARSFLSYNANMRQLTVDKLMGAEMIVLNRATDDLDKEEIHRVVRGISRRVAITYDYPDGHVEYDEIEDPLPFDLDAPVVRIEDDDYAVFYRDLSEEMEKYDGKILSFKGIAARDAKLGERTVLLGRHVMVCCADDVSYSPIVCVFSEPTSVKTGDWLTVKGKVRIEKHKLYRGQGPVLYVESTSFAARPAREIATFY